MKAETLKKAILQYAMQGKLAVQNPADEPASVLLERIKAEKEQLIKDGKIKKEKPLPPITEDEIPYELPKGWEWVRLIDIGYTQTGTTPSTSHPEYFNGEYPFVKPASILNNGKVNYIGETLTEIGLNNGRVITPNTVLMVCIGGSIGKVGIIDRLCSFNQQINSVTCYVEEMAKYIFYCLFSPYFYNTVLNIAPQTTLPIISKGKWEQILVPLPPLAEQQRIVEKLEQILPLVEEYGKNEEKLSKLNSTLPDKIKQSILQYAVQGKLVPQNPSDEPASELLKRIKAEKEQLIKDGKIKKEKPLPPITKDEIPYELPKGWEVIRLSNIAIFENGDRSSKYPTEDEYVSNGIPFWGAKDIINNKLQANSELRFISQSKFDELRSGKLNNKDFICLLRGSVGKWAEFTITDEWTTGFINAQMVIIRLFDLTLSNWFKVYLNSPLFIEQVSKVTTGSAVAQMSAKDLMNFIIYVPPLAEQHRIAAKAEELLAIADKLK